MLKRNCDKNTLSHVTETNSRLMAYIKKIVFLCTAPRQIQARMFVELSMKVEQERIH